MALAYAERHLPRSPLLLFYGDDFADFIATFEPARDLAYLPDVIRLEAARGHAYHAADAVPLDPAALAQVPSDRLPDLVFSPHPSLSILSSIHPVATIWAMNGGGLEPGPIKPWTGETALVVRPRLLVDVLRLEPAEAAFLQALAGGATLGAAAEDASALRGFDLAAALVRLLQSGAFTAIRKDNTNGH
ncbi:MAG TPA: DUF2063 domain-containing protein [Shinella sp.]|jgi:hypothetical protein|uniref:DUF2063 domain-containing protein n=1 Tax=Shinella sp. TaxID=1870904 RepID=UPI0029B52D6B|nr:DUF2063 domain-containing protein [Shinella sp.]MDX3978497.1 DUF2063 domain-containing protein [Shinella sp.]HEV7247593.1 DUF2063 domain-containing protein [Shinella sp.]